MMYFVVVIIFLVLGGSLTCLDLGAYSFNQIKKFGAIISSKIFVILSSSL